MGLTLQNLPQCAVIICHHTGTLIDRCVASLATSTGLSHETVVLTSDPQWHDPNGTRTRYVEGGPAHKRNVGVRLTRAPYLVFLDDDVEISPYCLWELWSWMEDHPTCGMAFGKILNMERRKEFDDCGSWLTWTGFLWARAGHDRVDRGQYDQPCPLLASKSATCIARRSAFLQVGGFDPDYYILGEETDLAWRMWLAGFECWYLPTAKSWHAFGTSLKPRQDYYTIRRVQTYGCRNYLSLLWTNLGRWRLMVIFPLHLCVWLFSAFGFLCRVDPRRAIAILCGIGEFAKRWPQLRRKRHRVQAGRIVSDRMLFRSIAYSPGIGYYARRLWRYWTTQLHG